MRYLAAFLLAPLLAMVAAALWFGMHFVVVPADRGDEWLIVRKERSAECQAHGGCQVMSTVEVIQAFRLVLQELQQRQKAPGSVL